VTTVLFLVSRACVRASDEGSRAPPQPADDATQTIIKAAIRSMIHGNPKKRVSKASKCTVLTVAGFALLCILAMRSNHQSSAACDDNASSYYAGAAVRSAAQPAQSAPSGLLTVRQMKQQLKLPCNYVHDGFYIGDSNEVLNQVYQSIMELDDDVVPVLVECGGHDGITKSTTLKASMCLNMNTLLIEASPSNFNILQQSRSYDFTVNAALCSGDSVQIVENSGNSGQTHMASEAEAKKRGLVTVKCTSIDAELDKLRATLPANQRDKLEFIFLVLDIEGQEPFAIEGIVKYRPHKAFMEIKHLPQEHKDKIARWAESHKLVMGEHCSSGQDACYNFHPLVRDKPSHLKALFYGARNALPEHTYATAQAAKACMFYGE